MEFIDIVAVKLIPTEEVIFYDSNKLSLKKNDFCVVPHSSGDRIAKVICEKTVPEDQLQQFFGKKKEKVVRKANTKDMYNNKKNLDDAKETLKTAKEKVIERDLKMKLLNSWYNLNRSKLTFIFSASGRIDFRELVKDLAHIFKTRIELYQIGVRDEIKNMGALGLCGREVCCKNWLQEFEPVTIKIAKMQCLNLAPHKVSGVCGRLLCCLAYEKKFYEAALKNFPTRNTKVEYLGSSAIVINNNVIKDTVVIKSSNVLTVELPISEFKELKVLEIGQEDY
jgi:cell fate regulator YaaT (PSP1 superfamily)